MGAAEKKVGRTVKMQKDKKEVQFQIFCHSFCRCIFCKWYFNTYAIENAHANLYLNTFWNPFLIKKLNLFLTAVEIVSHTGGETLSWRHCITSSDHLTHFFVEIEAVLLSFIHLVTQSL